MTIRPGEQLDIIFDGTSAFYTVIRNRLGASGRVEWVACQATEPSERGGRLCERTLVAITAAGEVDTGWRALARAFSVARGTRWSYQIATLPIVCPVLSMVFAAVAPLLRRLPGVTPWCARHPEDCHSAG